MGTFRKRLYSLTQEELLEQIEKELRAEGIEYKKDNKGGIWSILHDGKPCFVAHMDTVIRTTLDYRAPILIENGIVTRPNKILGADDRAGINIILNHKHHINFCLTLDEEIGAIGAHRLSLNKDFIDDCDKINFFCELDRMNSNDCISYTHGYSNKELSDKFIKLGFKDTRGVFTDIDNFTDIAQGVNISVGYYKQHTNKEYLVLDEFEHINSLIPEINKIKVDRDIVTQGGKYSFYGYEKCQICGEYHHWYDMVDGMCRDCYEDLIGDFDDGAVMHECGICHRLIPNNEDYYEADGLDLYFCTHCVTKKEGGR